MLDFETSNSNSEVSKSNLWEITSFSKTITSEGAVSHNVLYYQQLSIACYQVSFYANNYLSNYQKYPLPLKLLFTNNQCTRHLLKFSKTSKGCKAVGPGSCVTHIKEPSALIENRRGLPRCSWFDWQHTTAQHLVNN